MLPFSISWNLRLQLFSQHFVVDGCVFVPVRVLAVARSPLGVNSAAISAYGNPISGFYGANKPNEARGATQGAALRLRNKPLRNTPRNEAHCHNNVLHNGLVACWDLPVCRLVFLLAHL